MINNIKGWALRWLKRVLDICSPSLQLLGTCPCTRCRANRIVRGAR
jgi:hypothetical protein